MPSLHEGDVVVLDNIKSHLAPSVARAIEQAGASVLPRAVDAFRAQHPGVELTVGQASPMESVERLREGRLDLALTVVLDERPAEGV